MKVSVVAQGNAMQLGVHRDTALVGVQELFG